MRLLIISFLFALVVFSVVACKKQAEATPIVAPNFRDSLVSTVLHMPKIFRGMYIREFRIDTVLHRDTTLNYETPINLNADTIYHRYNSGWGTLVLSDTLFFYHFFSRVGWPYDERFS